MALKVDPALDTFMDTFAPIPTDDETDKWVNFILDMISMVATAGFGSIFNSCKQPLNVVGSTWQKLNTDMFLDLSKFPVFQGDKGANFKDSGVSLIGGIINAAKDFKNSNGK